MQISHAEIRGRLERFVVRWEGYSGSEKAEAIPFLGELLECYGTDRHATGIRFEFRTPSGGFIDMLWPSVCLAEMKAPAEARRLATHREQAFRYWLEVGTDEHPPPPFVLLCAFRRFQVWQPGYAGARADFSLEELPEKLEALGFLGGLDTFFPDDQAELTREAVALVTDLYKRLGDRLAAGADVLRDFILQCVWCMFAEDLAMIPGHVFTRTVELLIRDPSRSSRDDLGTLFRYLGDPTDRPTQGLFAGTPYADGQLFEKPAVVHLEPEELTLLREACAYPWQDVQPSIFGSLLQGALGRERQWALGAHYTAVEDILEVVRPTIVEPWSERIEACTTIDDVDRATADLAEYVVLDPACGSGNFLYVAYRELRRLEQRLVERERDIRVAGGLPPVKREQIFKLTNLRGIEIEPFAVKLARVTLWMGHKLAVDELRLEEAVLPLENLSGIQPGDALRLPWPKADAIIGNPPYHGSQRIRRELGDKYADWLIEEFGIGLKDYAVYWFRKAHERLGPGGRAGLVATNSISQNRNRGPSLEWIVENGGVITDAVSSKDWSGHAAVDVSIINWVKQSSQEARPFLLDGREVAGISPSLRPFDVDVSAASRLVQNTRRSFQGPIPAGDGFVLNPEQAATLLLRDDSDYSRVVRPYLIGDDIANEPTQAPTRWVIDFALMPLEEAARWPAALEIVRTRVKPAREQNRRKLYRERWWQFAEPRPGMRAALDSRPRYVASVAQGKRIFFTWQAVNTCPSNLTNVFAFDDDFSMGVLSSTIHHEWARAQSSTLEDRFRYTPTSAFETFPWPLPKTGLSEAVSDGTRAVIARRQQICVECQIGLTKLYNEVDEGAYRDLRELHIALDEAVAAAYGWPVVAAHDSADSNRRLLELNRQIVAGEVEYRPFDSSS